MAFSISKFSAKEVELKIEIEEDELLVRYQPNAMTPRMELAMGQQGSDERFLDLFCEVVKYIDVTGPLYDSEETDAKGNPLLVVNDGETIPVDPYIISLLPSRFVTRIMNEVMDDMTKRSDPKGSLGTNSSRRSRNGSLARAK